MFNKDTLDKSAVDINKLINSVLGLVYFDLRQNSIESQIHLGEAVPSVIGSAVQLQQVILNLIMNAIESMSAVEPRVLTIKSESDSEIVIRPAWAALRRAFRASAGSVPRRMSASVSSGRLNVLLHQPFVVIHGARLELRPHVLGHPFVS